MERCFILYDVQSQSQYSVHQRREELFNEGQNNDDGHVYFETYDGSDMQHTQVPETQENEEVYRVNIDEETRPSNEFTHEPLRQNSSPAAPVQIPTSRVQQRLGVRHGSTSQRGAGSSRVSTRSGSQGNRRKQSFERTLTDTITGFREFQRQSLQQLRPNSFDEDDYKEFSTAVNIFESMELPSDNDFYWACIHALKEERFWRKYFIDRAERTIEDKLKFLQALTGYTKDGEYVGKRLACGQNFGSPSASGFSSGSPSFGSPSFGGNCSWGQTSGGQWSPRIQQWGTPPIAPQWGAPPNAPQWGAPPNAPQWGAPPNVPHWGAPPNAPQWGSPPSAPQLGTSPNGPQWGAPPNAPQWGSPPSAPQLGTSPNGPQWRAHQSMANWSSSPNILQWGVPPNAQQCIPPTNIQHGFSLGTEVENTTNPHQRVSHEEEVPSTQNIARGVSPEFGFTNYSSTGRTSRPRRRGGLFNIWGSERGPNLNETHQSDSASEN